MRISKRIQRDIDEYGMNYNLKTNQELTDYISDTGFGEDYFHVADVDRLIEENIFYEQKLNQILESWLDVTTSHTQMENLIKSINEIN